MSSTSRFTAPPERCPRCGGDFVCGATAGLTHCDCFELQLGDALRAELARQWPGQCLCLRCLRELALTAPASPAPAPSGS